MLLAADRKPRAGGADVAGMPCWGLPAPVTPSAADTPAAAARLPRRADRQFDVVIVGAGLAGSATALRLAQHRPDLRVCLLDARHAGGGASGRGTGLLGPRVGPPIDVARRRFGDLGARALFQRSEQAVRDVIDLAGRYAPEALSPCDGQLVTGFTPAEEAAVRRRAKAYLDLGLDVPLVPVHGRALPARTDAPALHYRTAAGVDPAALTRAIASAAIGLGVHSLDGTTVHQLVDQPGRRTRLATASGDIVARAVILTADAAAPGLALPTPGLLELEVCASATAVLPAGLLAAFGGPAAAQVLAATPLGAYRRITPDGRLVIGGGPATAWRGLSATALARRRQAAWTWQRTWLDHTPPCPA